MSVQTSVTGKLYVAVKAILNERLLSLFMSSCYVFNYSCDSLYEIVAAVCVRAVWRTAWHQTRCFSLWRKPCKASPFRIREQEYSAGRRRAPLAGSPSTTWMIVSNRFISMGLDPDLCKSAKFKWLFVRTRVSPLCNDLISLLFLLQGLETTGALDLGGASTQISFVARNYDISESPSNSVAFRLYGNDYNLYTHSFLCYGKDQVLRMALAHQTQVNL